LSFFGTPETGGRLNTALHLYNYRSHSERLLKRSQLASNPDWHLYLEKVKCSMIQQSSEIYVEATSITRKFEEVRGLQHFIDIDQENEDDGEPSLGIVEMRKYELQLGYDTVPKFLDIYGALSSKLKTTAPTTELATVLVNEVGRLNCVYEIWKHGGPGECGFNAMESSRKSAREASEWRSAIADIAELALTFNTTIMRPLEFSPIK